MNEKTLSDFGKALGKLMVDRDRKNAEFSKALGICPSYLSAMMHGHNKITAGMLKKIIRELGLVPNGNAADIAGLIRKAVLFNDEVIIRITGLDTEMKEELLSLYCRYNDLPDLCSSW